MNETRTYLDYNASAPLRRGARVAMSAAMGLTGNASSVHAEGRAARALVETAREQVAELLGAMAGEIVFTGGGTEANNWVIGDGWDSIFLAGIEHGSVLAPARRCGARLIDIPVGADGVVDPETFAALARAAKDRGRALLALQMANNETGILQPVAQIAAIAREYGIAVHTDAVQAAGRLPIDFAGLGADYLTISGHKLGGPKGVGVLVIRDGAALAPLIAGGGQERGRRAGTENIAAIAGLAASAEAARHELAAAERLRGLRDRLERDVMALSPHAVIIGAKAPRLCNTSAIALPGHGAETLVIKLDLAGVAVSAGAACSSGKVASSHVLEAMGLGFELSGSAIRVSLGWGSSADDVDTFLETWAAIAIRGGSQHTRHAVA